MKTNDQPQNIPTRDLAVIRQEILSQAQPLAKSVGSLAVVDRESYANADTLLSRVGLIREGLDARVQIILDPLDNAKREIDKSRKELTKFRDELDSPLGAMEVTIRGLMQDFKREELRQIREAEDRRAEQERKDRQAAEEARRKAANTPSAQLQRRLERTAADLDAKADIASVAPLPTPTAAAHSGTRVVKKAKVTDLGKFLLAVSEGIIPTDVITVRVTALEDFCRLTERVGKPVDFPGVEWFEDVQIVRR